jgi:hypothetical protein
MTFDSSVVLTWTLCLALFPLAFFSLHRACGRPVGRARSDVAFERGRFPSAPPRSAPCDVGINGTARGGR